MPEGGLTLRFYQEKESGDYLVADETTAEYYKSIGRPGELEGRATAIAGELGSVQSTGMSWAFLRKCRRVSRKDVPRKWLDMLIGEEE